MTVYMRKARSLTLEEMTAIRRWLRLCYQGSSDPKQQDEIAQLGRRINECIRVASATDCEIAEW